MKFAYVGEIFVLAGKTYSCFNRSNRFGRFFFVTESFSRMKDIKLLLYLILQIKFLILPKAEL